MISFLKTAYRLGTLNDCSILYSFPKSPVHQGAETGGTGAFGGNGNVDSWTVPHVGQVTLAFSSICSWLWPAIPSRNAVNVGPQSLQRSAVFSSVIVVLSETPNRLSATSRAMGGKLLECCKHANTPTTRKWAIPGQVVGEMAMFRQILMSNRS